MLYLVNCIMSSDLQYPFNICALNNLAMILLSMWLFCTQSLSITTAQLATSSINNARALDALLQHYAYQAFLRPRTGVIYDGVVPTNLTGIHISAMRLRSGSFRAKGFSMYKEFDIPKGIVARPYVERLVLVYHNLGNWSTTYYPIVNHTFLAPVLGLLAYDAYNLIATNSPELDIQASDQPIRIQFSELRKAPYGTVPKCVAFDTNGSINFSNVLSDNICATFQQGHFSIVVESVAASFPPVNATKRGPIPGGDASSETWIIVSSVVGGFIVLAIFGFMVVWMSKYNYRKKMDEMEKAAEIGEALNMTSVGRTRAPIATGTRTHPKLESEYVP